MLDRGMEINPETKYYILTREKYRIGTDNFVLLMK